MMKIQRIRERSSWYKPSQFIMDLQRFLHNPSHLENFLLLSLIDDPGLNDYYSLHVLQSTAYENFR